MGEYGTAKKPPVDINRLKQFISEGNPWLQERSVFAAEKNANKYGINSVPVGTELLSLALYHWDDRIKGVAEDLVIRCIKNRVESDELMKMMVKTAEGAVDQENDDFFAECALLGIKNGHEKKAVEILASVVGRESSASDTLDMFLGNLRETIGEGSRFTRIKKKLERAVPWKCGLKARPPAGFRNREKPLPQRLERPTLHV
ncbi:MAG: hypothetical protein ACLFUZ_01415 [Candidatus Micrarchaeia archaeon]